VIGAIKATKTAAELETTGLVLKLYRQHFGTFPVRIDGSLPPLDVSAALSPGGDALTIADVNPSQQQQAIQFQLPGAKLPETGKLWTLTGPDKWSYNAPGKPRQVDIVESTISGDTSQLAVRPRSVTLARAPHMVSPAQQSET